MIFEDIKNAVVSALYKCNSEITVYTNEMKDAKFPFCSLILKDFTIEPSSIVLKTKYEFTFQIVSMMGPDNDTFQLLEMEELLKKALTPCLQIKNKKITLDGVKFYTADKKLLMDFKLSFYEIEEDTDELMQTLDITIKENNYAR